MIALIIYLLGCVASYFVTRTAIISGGYVWRVFDRVMTIIFSAASWVMVATAILWYLIDRAQNSKSLDKPAKW